MKMFVRTKTIWILFVFLKVSALDVGANNLRSVNIFKNNTTINENVSENPQQASHELHFISKNGDVRSGENLQNDSRTAVKEHATVSAVVDTQMNKTEKHAPCKLPQTTISYDLKKTKENATKINEGVYHIKLAELVNDREHKHDETTTFGTKLMSNEVQYQQQAKHKVNDFTGKLLEEEDGGIISEIEQKFRINELTTKTPELHGSLERLDAVIGKIFVAAAAKEGAIQPQYSTTQLHQVFLDRRVKKSFDFPTHHVTLPMPMPTTTTTNDFAKTKFSNGSLGKTHTHPEFSTTKFYNSKELYNEMLSNKNNTLNTTEKNNNNNNNNNPNYQQSQILSKQYAVLTNPKFKTYRKAKDMNLPSYAPPTAVTLSTIKEITNSVSSYGRNNAISTTTTTNSSLQVPAAHGEVVSAEVVPTQTETEAKADLERAKWRLKAILPVATNSHFTNTDKNNYHNTHIKSTFTTTTDTPSIQTKRKPIQATTTSTLREVNTTTTTTGYVKGKAKISFETKQPSITTTSTPTTSIPLINSTISTTIVHERIKTRPTTTSTITTNMTQLENSITTSNSYTSTASLSQHRTTNPTKSSSKPISRPRILSQLQLKINALECEIANISPVAHLWRGNETHELLLPIMVSK